MKKNKGWVTPKHGEVCGMGHVSGGTFVDIYDEGIGDTRQFWNFDTNEDDVKRMQARREMESKIKAGKYWNGE